MTSPRLRSAVVRGLSVGVIFFVVRLLLLLIPGRAHEPLVETVFVAVVVGIVWGIFSWLIWPREQQRLADRARRDDERR